MAIVLDCVESDRRRAAGRRRVARSAKMDVACSNHPVKIGGSHRTAADMPIRKSCRFVKKRLHLFAGFDDYPKANCGDRRGHHERWLADVQLHKCPMVKNGALRGGRPRSHQGLGSLHKYLEWNWLDMSVSDVDRRGEKNLSGSGL